MPLAACLGSCRQWVAGVPNMNLVTGNSNVTGIYLYILVYIIVDYCILQYIMHDPNKKGNSSVSTGQAARLMWTSSHACTCLILELAFPPTADGVFSVGQLRSFWRSYVVFNFCFSLCNFRSARSCKSLISFHAGPLIVGSSYLC